MEENLQYIVTDLEARVGRQAITIETLQAQLADSHLNYTKLISHVALLLTGEVALERFKILTDGTSWQILALPDAAPAPENFASPDDFGVVRDSASTF